MELDLMVRVQRLAEVWDLVVVAHEVVLRVVLLEEKVAVVVNKDEEIAVIKGNYLWN